MSTKFSEANVRILSCLAALLIVPWSQAQYIESPCPEALQYDLARPGQQYGTIYLRSDKTVHLQSLVINLDKKANVFVNWMADVTTTDNMNFVLTNSNITISPYKATSLRFYVNYNMMTGAKVPLIKRIVFNGMDICNVDNPVAVITRRTKPANTDPGESSGGESGEATEQCGRVVKENINQLIVRGSTTSEGEWPWHVAIFQLTSDPIRVSYTYSCGGTLVSHYHVITAAHCVTVRKNPSNENQDPRPVMPVNVFNIYLGTHNLRNSGKGVQINLVSQIVRHPEYNNTHDRDLAIIRLRDRVNYTPWVQPICLWPADETSLSDIVGKVGSVVGWGLDENQQYNVELSLVNLPVVSSATCRRSRPTFYGNVDFDYTYCAGGNGPSPCNGDSGGGMVFKMGHTWFLRGVVSISLSRDRVCDPEHYVVFTDLAKFLPWIKEKIT